MILFTHSLHNYTGLYGWMMTIPSFIGGMHIQTINNHYVIYKYFSMKYTICFIISVNVE